MKLNGKNLEASSTKEVVLYRPPTMVDGKEVDNCIRFVFSAMPMGFEKDIEKIYPSPKPPRNPLLKNNRAVRDKGTGEPVMFKDFDNEQYREKDRICVKHQFTYYIYRSLENDPNVEFDAEPGEDMDAFADAIYEELKQAGLTSGDFGEMVNSVTEVNNLKGKAIEEAMEGFLSESQ